MGATMNACAEMVPWNGVGRLRVQYADRRSRARGELPSPFIATRAKSRRRVRV